MRGVDSGKASFDSASMLAKITWWERAPQTIPPIAAVADLEQYDGHVAETARKLFG